MKKEIKLPSAKETLEIIDKPWCTVDDICILIGGGRNKAFNIKNEINQKLINQGFNVLDRYVPTDQLVCYLNLNIDYLKKVSAATSEDN